MRRTSPNHAPPGPAPEQAPGGLPLPSEGVSRRRLDLLVALATLVVAGAIVGVGIARRGPTRAEQEPPPAPPTSTPAAVAEVEK